MKTFHYYTQVKVIFIQQYRSLNRIGRAAFLRFFLLSVSLCIMLLSHYQNYRKYEFHSLKLDTNDVLKSYFDTQVGQAINYKHGGEENAAVSGMLY